MTIHQSPLPAETIDLQHLSPFSLATIPGGAAHHSVCALSLFIGLDL